MMGPLRYFGLRFFLPALGAAVAAVYLSVEPGLLGAFLIILFLLTLSQYLHQRYRPKHLEDQLLESAKPPPAPAETKTEKVEARVPLSSSALVAKPSLLEAVGKEALESRDLKVISGRALDYLSRYVRAADILFLARRAEKLVVLTAKGPNAAAFLGSEYAQEGSLASVLGAAGASLNMSNLAVDMSLGFKDKLTGKLAELGAVSLLVAAAGQTGLLVLTAARLDAFTKFDEAAVEGVAFQLAYIAENIRQEAYLKQTAEGLDKLLNLVNRVHSGEDLSDTLQTTLAAAVEMTGATSGSFLLFDESRNLLVLRAAVGLPESAMAVEIKPGEGISGWVAVHRKPVVIKDLNGEGVDGTGLGPDKIAAALAVPILLGDKLVGVLNLGSAKKGHEFAAKALDQVVRLLGQTGAAVVSGQANEAWQRLYVDTVGALAQVIESRDPFSRGHAAEVSKYAGSLARAMRLSADEVQTMELAGLLHDIGTAGITDSLFRQERPLNSVERLLIRSHPRLGAKALAEISRLRSVLPMILHHHENFDGTGYAEGLKGEEIPLGARILAVVEAYTAMTAERPYRPAKTPPVAIDELRRDAGAQFDPQIVYIFCNLLERESSVRERSE